MPKALECFEWRRRSMYKLSFDLEPLTYMVHFQKDDANATIRASELKPMFDRYLTEVIRNSKNKLNKDDYPILESYSEDEAVDESDYLHFDYQVRVELQNGRPNTSHKDSNREFFFKEDFKINGIQQYKKDSKGNYLLNKNNKKIKEKTDKFSLILTYPKVTFLTRHATLSMLIQKYFEYFVAISFFGFRKGKGYGQFKIRNSKNCRKELIEEASKKVKKETIAFEISMGNRPQKPYSEIAGFINRKNSALKDALIKILDDPNLLNNNSAYSYLVPNKKTLELYNIKKGIGDIKKGTYQTDKTISSPQNVGKEIRYVRGLLGVADTIGKYKVTNESPTATNNNGKFIVQRFPNPLKYYVLDCSTVYVVIEVDSIKKLMDKVENPFYFIDGNFHKEVPLPSSDQIDLDKFLEFIKTYLPKV